MVQFLGQVVPVHLNIDDKPAAKVSDKFNIDVTPTILFVDGKGKVHGKILGYVSPADFLKRAKPILAKYKAAK